MIKAFFLDFYGTVVHEDGEIIKKITQIIYDTGESENMSEIDAFCGMIFKICLQILMEIVLRHKEN